MRLVLSTAPAKYTSYRQSANSPRRDSRSPICRVPTACPERRRACPESESVLGVLSHPKKVLDNRYTVVITFFMLPRQLTLPPQPHAELTPLLSYSCKLFCAPEKVNSRKISKFRTLPPKPPGWRVHPHHPVSLAP